MITEQYTTETFGSLVSHIANHKLNIQMDGGGEKTFTFHYLGRVKWDAHYYRLLGVLGFTTKRIYNDSKGTTQFEVTW